MVIVKCTAPDVYAKNIWGSAVQSKATKNQHATHTTHITHITLTPPTVRCFGFAQHDKSAITPPPQYPHHHNAGIISNTRDVYSLSYSIRTAHQRLRLRSAWQLGLVLVTRSYAPRRPTALRVLFLIPVMFRRGGYGVWWDAVGHGVILSGTIGCYVALCHPERSVSGVEGSGSN